MPLAYDLQRICQGCRRNDRSTVLVIVEHRNVQHLLQLFFDVKTFRGFNVFEIDPAKRRGDRCNDLDNFIRVVRIQFDVKNVNIRKFLK